MSGTSDPAALAARLAALKQLHQVRDWSHQPEDCDICFVVSAYDALAEAVLAFAAKYDELDPAVRTAFVFQATHGFPYTGPTWEVERSAMLALAWAGRGGHEHERP